MRYIVVEKSIKPGRKKYGPASSASLQEEHTKRTNVLNVDLVKWLYTKVAFQLVQTT